MTKENVIIQNTENERVKNFWEENNIKISNDFYSGKSKRLDYMTADTTETDEYIILRSYNTIIATIDKATGTYYDYLEYVYGFTATSSKHLSRFTSKYRKYIRKIYRYKNISSDDYFKAYYGESPITGELITKREAKKENIPLYRLVRTDIEC